MINPSHSDSHSHYYQRFKGWMIPFFSKGSHRVLDLGCAAGLIGNALLQEGRASEMIGVEIFPPAAEEARKYYREVFVGDIETMQIDYPEYFDYVVCGDILEHLKDPYTIMRRIHSWLKPGGIVFICLPNVRNFRVITDLLFRGRWDYTDAGIMDRTHLRFFTLDSCRRMLLDAGFNVYHTEMLVEGPKKRVFNRATFRLLDEFIAAQMFLCGSK